MKLWLLLLALLVAEICLAQQTSVPPKAKNGTGPGRSRQDHRQDNRRDNYHSNRRHRERDSDSDEHDDHDDKDDHDYGKHRRHRTPIVDDYICDLEATILVVSSKHHVKEEKTTTQAPIYGNNNNSPSYGAPQQQYGGSQQAYGAPPQQSYGGGPQSYGGNQQSYGTNGPSYGESSPSYGQKSYEEKPKRREYASPDALRLKCSHIAVNSEHDCHTCCQLSARRYHSVSKHEIFGFIIDASEIKENDKGYIRSKRNNDYGTAPTQSYSTPAYSTDAPSYSTPAANYQAPENEYSVPEYQEKPKDSEYQASAPESYSPKAYSQYGRPEIARCVCCSPKRHQHSDNKRRRHRDDDHSHDRSDSHEH